MNHNQYRHLRLRRTGPKIDLGCGTSCRPGYIGIDFQDFGQDILWDVRYGIPMADGSVSHLHSSHFVEHLTDDELALLWLEIMRVCRVGSVVDLRCPHAESIEAFYNNHLSLWNGTRIRGVVAGFATPKLHGRFKRKFHIALLEKKGIELITRLEIVP